MIYACSLFKRYESNSNAQKQNRMQTFFCFYVSNQLCRIQNGKAVAYKTNVRNEIAALYNLKNYVFQFKFENTVTLLSLFQINFFSNTKLHKPFEQVKGKNRPRKNNNLCLRWQILLVNDTKMNLYLVLNLILARS